MMREVGSKGDGVEHTDQSPMCATRDSVFTGYRNTEVGIIPHDWEVITINQIARKVGSGKTPTGGSSVYLDSGRPFIRSQNIGWGRLLLSDMAYISDQTHSTFLSTELKEGDVLLNITGASIGRCAIADKRVAAGNVNQHVCIIRCDRNMLLPRLLQDLIVSSLGQNQIESYQAGGNREGLNFSQVGSLKFAIPSSSEEQTAIANALSDVDALVNSLEKLIAKKQAIKTATMQQLLTGKTRLPEFAKWPDGTPKGYKQTELGEVPEDWDVTTVYDLAENQKSLFDDGDWIEAEHITTKGVRLIQTGNIGVGHFLEKDVKKYIYEESFEKLGCKSLKIGDLLICRLAEPAGRACILPDIGEDRVITSVDVTIFRPSENLADGRFYAQYFSSAKWFTSVSEQVGGTTHKRISRGALGRIAVPHPSKEEQTRIATILCEMDTEIQNLQKRLTKTQQLKQGMMQELLTGRTRLV